MTAIQVADVQFMLSAATGPGGTVAQGTVTASYGGFISSTHLNTATPLANLFPATTTINETTYRVLFVWNNTLSGNTLTAPVTWLQGGDPVGGATITIGVDPTAASPVGSGTAQSVTSASGTGAPAGVTFSAPATVGTGISLGDIPPGYCKPVWIRRVTPAVMPTPQFTENMFLGISGATSY